MRVDSASVIHRLEVPSTYTETRLNYELTAPGDVLVQQKLRVFQKQYLDYLCEEDRQLDLFQYVDEDESDDGFSSEEFPGSDEELSDEDSDAGWDRLAAKLDRADARRDAVLDMLPEKLLAATESLEKGNRYLEEDGGRTRDLAIPNWVKACCELRPFYPEALALDDHNRGKLGLLYILHFYATLWLGLASAANWEDAPKSQSKKQVRQRIAAYRCAWVSWANREYASADLVRSACLLAGGMLLAVYRGKEFNNSNRKELWAYFDKQSKALEDVPKDKLFKDLEPELKIPLPGRDALDAFGPAEWDSILEHFDTGLNPLYMF
ncbi:hypothetical protein IAT38_007703 [Cryptococcus sp. DSM 104549]